MTEFPLAAFIEAEIRLLATEEGGRRSAIGSGYRCNCWIGHVDENGRRTHNDATFYLLDAEKLVPGATGRARVLPHNPDYWTQLEVGSRFELCEGSRVVGKAVIAELFPSRSNRDA
jgi:translation elongation factor EF-Tu-like GTPase